MGNRKERRHAAKTAVNRRVKLDLLAEPSGDYGDSSNKEVGGGENAKNHAGSPNSPSSSGQRPENPLLLLGQYSDEEPEEESGKELSRDTRENSPAELDEQVKVDGHEGTGGDKDENLTADKIDQDNKEHSSSMEILPKLEENGVIENSTVESQHRDTDAHTVEQTSLAWASDTQTTGDMDSGWKMVLHEESNSYYYWNIVTGETSWEVPVAFGQENESAHDPKSATGVQEMHTTSVDTRDSDANLDAEMDASVGTQPNNGSTNTMVFEATEIDGSRPELEVDKEKYTDIMTNDKDKGNHVNDALSNGEANHIDSSIQDARDHEKEGKAGYSSSDSYRLLQLGENLLERLKSLNGSEGFSNQISKLMFELDIRLADIKSLVAYGSSLLPFWLHSEDQLKKLEAAINNEVLKCFQFANIGETNESENELQENICEATANGKNTASTSLEFDASDHASTPQREAEDVVPKVVLDPVEDVDMDVEMEVEDAITFDNAPVEDESGDQNKAQPDQSVPPNPLLHHEPRGSEEEFDVPPPPNDEWIPPPPPDDEPFPPPPPDEPPEALFPPPSSEMQTAQPPYSYGEQYNFTYPGSGFEYYGQTNTEVPGHDYYAAASLPTLYYAAVPNPYPDANSLVNTGEPVTYYTLQEGSVPTASVIGGVETSGLHKSVHESFASDQTESMAAWKDRQLSSSQVGVSAVDREIGMSSMEVPSISASTHVLETSTVTSDVSVVSASAVTTTVAPTEPVPKVQPKVTRVKKRTVASAPSLRSNKKVSGLVDKWKAVKEELHEDAEDDKPENAYEVLEKKRQREIEQWHAQQIASGEAKDNANFQPLGGDWRERVRRKRAKKSIEAEENVAKGIDDTNQQPDLVQLSKQLPSGWQAYWDEASKQVYYANSTTSETTWTKPTN